MNTKNGSMLGALGFLAIGLSAGAAVAASPGEAYIAGQLLPPMLQTTRGLPIAGNAPRSDQAVAAVAPAVSAMPPSHVRRPVSNRTVTSPHPTVSLDTIQFEFASAQLDPTSIDTLRDLGNALNQELKDQKLFVIEGHTDAAGSRALNAALSQHRAEAVKEYLVHDMGVSPDRLQAVGKGSSEPVVKNPYAAQNRRVLVINPGA